MEDKLKPPLYAGLLGFACVSEEEWVAALEAGLLTALFHITSPLHNDAFLLLGGFQSIPSRHFSALPPPVPPLQIFPSLPLNFWINCKVREPSKQGRGEKIYRL